jgi:type IV pilus assembly protein PilM
MSLFGGPAKKSYLGIDIGAGGIKVVELLSEKGRARLMTYGYSERRPTDPPMPPLEHTKETAEVLSKICKQAKTTSTKAMAALPLSSVFSAIISVPREKDEKLIKEAINAQVRKLTPVPLEEMITYSTFIDPIKPTAAEKGKKEGEIKQFVSAQEGPKKKDYIRVLVSGSPKSLVQKYIEIFKLAKLELQALDTEAFALIRSLVGKDKSTVMILDIGYLRTNITVVEKGVPFLTRSINVGGGTVTKKIMTQLNVSEEEAERMKHDLGTMTAGAGAATGGMPTLLESVMTPLVNEIRYATDLYTKMEFTENRKLEKIIITGGSAHLPHLSEYLSQTLNLNVYVGDPWARVIFPEDLRPVLDEVGPRLAVAVGLAMREID